METKTTPPKPAKGTEDAAKAASETVSSATTGGTPNAPPNAPLSHAAPPASAESTENALRQPSAEERAAISAPAGDLAAEMDRRRAEQTGVVRDAGATFLDAETDRASAAGFVERSTLPARDVGEVARERQDREALRQEELGRVQPRFVLALPPGMVGGRDVAEADAERRRFTLSFPVIHDGKLRLAGDSVPFTFLQFGELRAAGSLTGAWSGGE